LGDETVDNTTLSAINAVQAIDLNKIAELQKANASDLTAKAEAQELTELLKQAYKLYTNITKETQLAFFTGDYDGENYQTTLTNALTNMRSVKDKFGIATTITRIKITTLPTKTVYTLGETIDTSGLVVTATYDDGTTGTITSYTLDRTTANTTGTRVRVNVTADGNSASFYIQVYEASNDEPSTEPDPEPDTPAVEEPSTSDETTTKKKGCKSYGTGEIALIVVALGATVLLLKKREDR
jgi:hypothetical protein